MKPSRSLRRSGAALGTWPPGPVTSANRRGAAEEAGAGVEDKGERLMLLAGNPGRRAAQAAGLRDPAARLNDAINYYDDLDGHDADASTGFPAKSSC